MDGGWTRAKRRSKVVGNQTSNMAEPAAESPACTLMALPPSLDQKPPNAWDEKHIVQVSPCSTPSQEIHGAEGSHRLRADK